MEYNVDEQGIKYNSEMVCAESLFKNGKSIRKASVMYLEDNVICDCCDEIATCAIMSPLGHYTMHICANCCQAIINLINE
jgi:hypothetical protein